MEDTMADKIAPVSIEELRQKEWAALVAYEECGDPPLAARYYQAQEERERAEREFTSQSEFLA
jgi:hypothetical protein